MLLQFPKNDTQRGRPLRDWLKKQLSGALWWNGSAWETNGIGADPVALLQLWGFQVGEGIAEAASPVTKLARNRRQVLVRPRLTGRTACQQLLGLSAVWDAKRSLFRLPIADVCPGGRQPRPGLLFSDEAIACSRARYETAVPVDADLQQTLTRAAHVTRPRELSRTDRDLMVERVGRLPDWFGIDLYPYQKVGAMAVACGRRMLADEPGVGKTYTSIAAATLMGSRRLLVVAPPLVITNWCRELARCGVSAVDATAGVFTVGEPAEPVRKLTAPPVDAADRPVAVVVSDSLLAARESLASELSAWGPDVIIWDEAHRGKTYGSKRSEAVLQLAADTHAAGIAVTGTPMLKTPAELAPLMEFIGVDVTVFNGLGQLLDETCTIDHHGRLRPRKSGESWLAERLRTGVMIRRRKTDVLPQLPDKRRSAVYVDAPMTEFTKAHREVNQKIDAWVKAWKKDTGALPSDEDILEYATGNLAYISQLRRAAGLCKIDAAEQMIAEHIDATRNPDGTFDDPLIVWTHHREVTEALAARVPGIDGAAMIVGGMNRDRRDELIDAFQSGKLGALVCSIHAAGVGITLTRSHTMIFVETDWTPGIMVQAEDRVHRAGQTADHISITTLVCEGTLDPIVQAALARKARFLDATIGGDNDVHVDEDADATATEVLVDLINTRVRSRRN